MKHWAHKFWNLFWYPLKQFCGYWKAYWFVRSITILIVLILVLAVLVQNTKETNYLAGWLSTFLSEWATVLGAAATLLLAGAAFWAIMDNRHGRILNRRERLLNEIIEWALEISKCGLEADLPSEFERTDEGYLSARTRLIQMSNAFRALLRRSRYIIKIVLPSWQKLNNVVEELRKQLNEQIKVIDEYIEDITNESKYKAVDDNRLDVNTLVGKVIDEASEIKTRDIG